MGLPFMDVGNSKKILEDKTRAPVWCLDLVDLDLAPVDSCRK